MVSAVLMLVAGLGFLLLGSGKLAFVLSKDPDSAENIKKWRKFFLGGGVFLTLAGVVVGLIELFAK